MLMTALLGTLTFWTQNESLTSYWPWSWLGGKSSSFPAFLRESAPTLRTGGPYESTDSAPAEVLHLQVMPSAQGMPKRLLSLATLARRSKHLSFVLVCPFNVPVVCRQPRNCFHYSWELLLLNPQLNPWTQRQRTFVVLFCSKSNN